MAESFEQDVLGRDLSADAVLAALLDSPSPANVHATRVLVKKLRARLRLVSALAQDQPDSKPLGQALKRLGKALSRRRDLDVARITLAGLLEKHHTKKLAAVGAELMELFAQHSSVVNEQGEDVHDLVGQVREGLHALDKLALRRKNMTNYLRDQILDCCDSGDTALKEGNCKLLHDWRKAVKTTYYQLEVLSESGKKVVKLADNLNKLGKGLGLVHDYCFMQELVEKYHEAQELKNDLTPLLKLLDKERDREIKKCVKLQRKTCLSGLLRIA